MRHDEIDSIEGAKGNSIRLLRKTDDQLDDALLQPNTPIESEERENDVEIASRLVAHDWDKNDIRRVLDKKRKRDKLSIHTNDSYLTGVLNDAGFRDRPSDADDSDDDDGWGDHGFNTDSKDVDSSKFAHIKF